MKTKKVSSFMRGGFREIYWATYYYRRKRAKLKQIHEVSLRSAAFKSTVMHIDLRLCSRATVVYFKKRRLSHDPKFTLDYELITGKHDWEFSRPETTSRRCFSLPTEDSYGCNYVLPDVLAFPASCGAYYQRYDGRR